MLAEWVASAPLHGQRLAVVTTQRDKNDTKYKKPRWWFEVKLRDYLAPKGSELQEGKIRARSYQQEYWEAVSIPALKALRALDKLPYTKKNDWRVVKGYEYKGPRA